MLLRDITMSHKWLQTTIEWSYVYLWASLIGAITTVGTVTWMWFQYNTLVATELQVAGGVGALLLILLFSLQARTMRIQIKLLHQRSIEHSIRFDLTDACKLVLREALAEHVPGYKKLGTQLNVGEELLREVQMVSNRYAEFQTKLSAAFPGVQLAEAIDALIAESNKAHEAETNVTMLMDYLESRS